MNMFKTTKAKTVAEYIRLLPDAERDEIKTMHAFIRKTVPTLKPFLLSGMIGYGTFHYKSKSGREGDWAVICLARQKNYISVYLCVANDKGYVAEQHTKDLPMASIGKSCIRFKKIADVDFSALAKILREAVSTKNKFMA